MNYLQFAELALNIYGDKPPPVNFTKLKYTENKPLGNGLYCCIYRNLLTDENILVIKGTSSSDDAKADVEYVLNRSMEEFNELRFYFERIRDFKLSYITGHSLGGILSKMSLGIHTNKCQKVLAFNSPGVKVSTHAKIETVVAVGDEVGHFSSNNDSGKYISVPILAQTKLERITERVVPALTAAGVCGLAGMVGGPIVATSLAVSCGIYVEASVILDEHQMKNLLIAMELDDRFKREF